MFLAVAWIITHFEKLLKSNKYSNPTASKWHCQWMVQTWYLQMEAGNQVCAGLLLEKWVGDWKKKTKGYSLLFLPDQIRNLKINQTNMLFLLLKYPFLCIFWKSVGIKSEPYLLFRHLKWKMRSYISAKNTQTCQLLKYCRESSNRRQVRRFHTMSYIGGGWCST